MSVREVTECNRQGCSQNLGGTCLKGIKQEYCDSRERVNNARKSCKNSKPSSKTPINIVPKFSVGDTVRVLQKGIKFSEKIPCPVCSGKSSALNPNYNKNGDSRKELICTFCRQGEFLVGEEECEVLSKSSFKVDKISITLSREGTIVKYVLINISRSLDELFDKNILILDGNVGSTIIVPEDRVVLDEGVCIDF